MTSDFYIPIDSAISQFGDHLRAYPRTILSARFGDGKTYFLDAVRKDEKLKEEFTFLTIYPINYQVMDNKDIFEIVKYDILWQLMLNEMITFDFEMSNKEKIAWFLKTNIGDFIMNIISVLPMIGLDSQGSNVAIVQAVKNLKSLYKNLKNDYEEFNEKYKSKGDEVEKFLESIDSNVLYEHDIITSIIRRAIEKYRKENNKKIVLIIEDMDRMDPAHAFRILNVFSAHMDCDYRYFPVKPSTLVGNKFGFDNIVVVTDYNNLKNIFSHFYGNDTSFEGYISKFLSGNYFEYSLKSIQKEYIIEKLIEITSLSKGVIQKVLTDSDLESKSIREIVQSFDISEQIPNKPIGKYQGKEFPINLSMLKLMAVLKRLKLKPKEIIERVLRLSKDNDDERSQYSEDFYRYVGPFMVEKGMIEKEQKVSPHIYAYQKDLEQIMDLLYDIDRSKGVLTLTNGRNIIDKNVKSTDFSIYVEHMLQFVV